MFNSYYIFEIKIATDENYGELLSVEATKVEFTKAPYGGYLKNVSENRYERDLFFFPNTPFYRDFLLNMAKANNGEWNVDFSKFNDKYIECDGIKRTAYYHKTIQKKKKSFWETIKTIFKLHLTQNI